MERRVLLVDADAAFVERVARDLGRSGVVLDSVEDDGLALDRARNDRPDVIVLSELPDRNVFAAVNRMRRSPGITDVPVVVLHTDASPSAVDAHRSSKTPAALYMRKPAPEALFGALRPLLGDDDVLEEVEPIEDGEAESLEKAASSPPPVRVEKPPAYVATPDPLAETGPDSRAPLGGSPEDKLQFFRDRLKATTEQVQKARAAWAERETHIAALHDRAAALYAAVQAAAEEKHRQEDRTAAVLREREATVAELEANVVEARRELASLQTTEAGLREQLTDAEGRARSLSEVLNDTLREREEIDRGWSARVAEVESQAEEQRTELAGLRAARVQLDDALGRAARELREARGEIDAGQGREAALQQDLDELRTSSAEREEALGAEAMAHREQLEAELSKVQAELENDLASVRGELSARVAELQGELSATRDEGGERALELEQVRGQVDDLSARLADATRQTEDGDRLSTQRAAKLAEAEKERDGLRADFLAARSRMAELERHLGEARADLAAHKQNAEAELEAIQAEAAEALTLARDQAEVDRLSEVDALRAELARAEERVAEERSQREADREAAQAEAEARIASAEADAAEAAAQAHAEAEARVAEARASLRADQEGRVAQAQAGAGLRVSALEAELERIRSQAEERVAAARAEAQERVAEAESEAEGRIAAARADTEGRVSELTDRYERQLDEVRREEDEIEDRLRAEMEEQLRKAKEEADEVIAHARSEIEEQMAASETDADVRVTTLEKKLAEARRAVTDAESREQEARAQAEERVATARAAAAAAGGNDPDLTPGRDPQMRIAELEVQLKSAIDQAQRYKSDRERAASAYERIREEAHKLRRQLAQPGGEVSDLKRELAEVLASRERLQDDLASQIASLVSDMSRKDADIAALKRLDAKATPDLKAALFKIELLERERDRLKTERESFEEDLERQVAIVATEGEAAVIRGLRSEIASLHEKLQDGGAGELERLRAENEELRAENEFLGSEGERVGQKPATPIARIKR